MKRHMFFMAALAVVAFGSCQTKKTMDPAQADSNDSVSAALTDTVDNESKTALPIVYDFSATWCGPCKMFAPVFDKVSKEYAGKAEFVKMDVDAEPGLAQMWGVRSVPTIIVAHPSTRQSVVATGAMSEEDFKAFLDKALQP